MGSVVVSSYDDDGVVFTPNLSGLTRAFMVFMFIKMVIVHQQ